MLSCRQLTMEEIRRIYKTRMKQDFSPDELKPLSMIEKGLLRGEYAFYGFPEDESIEAYACLVILPEHRTALLDYFAVRKEMRGKGIGSEALRLLRNQLPELETILCEAENPAYAETPEEKQLRLRRIQFYLRNQFRTTGVTVNLFHVEYVVLELQGCHTDEQIREAYLQLYRSFLPPLLFRKYVKVLP